MRKSILAIIAWGIALTAMTLHSCGKLPANGDLDGQWQLMEINTKQTAESTTFDSIRNVKNDRTYWRFQLDLLMIHSRIDTINGKTPDTNARFLHQGHELDITKTYIHFRNRDSLLTDPNTKVLENVGISGNAEKFKVEKLNSKQMILSNDAKRLVFRKF